MLNNPEKAKFFIVSTRIPYPNNFNTIQDEIKHWIELNTPDTIMSIHVTSWFTDITFTNEEDMNLFRLVFNNRNDIVIENVTEIYE